MSTSHVMLALLSVKPMTGYELSQNMERSLNSLWAATPSQIYPTLHKLEEKKFVTCEENIRGKRMKRFIYTLTEKGEEELNKWLLQPIQYIPFRDPFKLWASYLDECPPDIVFKNIDEHIRLNTIRAETLEQIGNSIVKGEHALIKVRADRVPERVEAIKAVRSMVFFELAKQARFEVESAIRIRAFAEEMFAD